MPMDLSLAAIGLNTQQSILAQIMGGANFVTELLHTAVPRVATPGTTATFTRATTETWPNNDGYMVTGVAGEIGFVGARRVRNAVVGSSEDFSNAAWTKSTMSATVAAVDPPAGCSIVTKLYPTGSGNDSTVRLLQNITVIAGNYYIGSIYLKYSGFRWIMVSNVDSNASNDKCWFDVLNGVAGTSGVGTISFTFEDVGNGWYRINTRSIAATTNGYTYISCVDGDASSTVTASGTNGVYLTGAMIEDVTAQTTQTAGEYVSVGVESAPYYHGSFVDGVKCFPTDLSGNPIPSTTMLGYQAQGARTNLCLQSNAFTTTWAAYNAGTATQNVVGPDGYTSAWTLTDNSAVAAMGVRQSIALTAATHTVSAFVKKTVGAQSSYPVIYLDDNVSKGASCTIDTTNGVATVWTAYTGLTIVTSSASCVSYNEDYWRVSLVLLATAATWTLYLLPAATTNATQSTGVWDVTAQGSAVFYGAQVELGSFASSYIATTTIAVARNADVLTYSSAGNISETAGSVYGELSTLWTTSTTNIAVSAATTSYPLGVNNNSISTIIVNRDGTNFSSKTSLSDMSTGVRKRAGSWSATGIAVTGDGASPGTASYDGAYGVGASLGVGNVADGSLQWFGTIRNVRIWQRQLSASELQAITS